MKTRIGCAAVIVACAVAASFATASAPAPDETAAAYRSMVEKSGPALVSVKMVLKLDGGGMGGDEGHDLELTGIMIDPKGLVLCSNVKTGGLASLMGRGAVTPTDVKVLIGDDTEGLTAKFLSRDSDLDLAWVQIDDPKAPDQTFEFIDLSASSKPEVGDRVFSILKTGKFLDHTLVVWEGRIGGIARKPRELLLPSGLMGDFYGLPVFTADGKVAGVCVFQMPNQEDMEGAESMDDLYRGMMVLPAAEVVRATKLSREAAAKGETDKPAEEARAADPLPAAEPKP